MPSSSSGRGRSHARAAPARDPDRERGLHDQHRPERERRAGIEDEAVDDGAADHQRVLVPARQIAAGVVFQQREAVPDRRRDSSAIDKTIASAHRARSRVGICRIPAVHVVLSDSRPVPMLRVGESNSAALAKPILRPLRSQSAATADVRHLLPSSSKTAGVPVTLREYLTLMQAMEADLASRRVEDFYYLSRAALVKDERNLDKFDRVFGHVFKGLEMMGERDRGRDPGRVAEEAGREIPHRGRKEADRGHGRARQIAGDAAPAAGRAEGPPPGRLEMDRHRRHLALRRLWLQSRKASASARTATATSAR